MSSKNIKSAFYTTGIYPVDFEKVHPRSRTSSGSSGGSSMTVVAAPSPPKSQIQLDLEAEYLEASRKMEEAERRLAQVKAQSKKRSVVDSETWAPDVDTLCDNMFHTVTRDAEETVKRKRMRRNARGSEAVILNSDEQLEAHRAATELKENKAALKATAAAQGAEATRGLFEEALQKKTELNVAENKLQALEEAARFAPEDDEEEGAEEGEDEDVPMPPILNDPAEHLEKAKTNALEAKESAHLAAAAADSASLWALKAAYRAALIKAAKQGLLGPMA